MRCYRYSVVWIMRIYFHNVFISERSNMYLKFAGNLRITLTNPYFLVPPHFLFT